MSIDKNKAYRTTMSFQMGSKYYSKGAPFNPANHQLIEVEKQLKRGLIEAIPAGASPLPQPPKASPPLQQENNVDEGDNDDEDLDDEDDDENGMTAESMNITPPVRRSPGRPKSTGKKK